MTQRQVTGGHNNTVAGGHLEDPPEVGRGCDAVLEQRGGDLVPGPAPAQQQRAGQHLLHHALQRRREVHRRVLLDELPHLKIFAW